MVRVLKGYKVFLQLPNLDLELVSTVIVDENKIIIPSHEIVVYSNGYGRIMWEHVKVVKHNIPVSI
jgi:hypothetical protein